MPPPIPVILVPSDPDWPLMANIHAGRLSVLGPELVTVHHVGSTSVPGLAAKPIIDLVPVVRDLTQLDRLRDQIEVLGYAWHGEYGIAGRRYCTLSDAAGVRLVQLHFFEAGSRDVTRHVAFRDYLREHPDVARAYEAEKRRARDLHPDNSHAYSEEKSVWIRNLEAAALDWFVARAVAVDVNR